MVDVDLEKQKFFIEGSKSYMNAQRAIEKYEIIIEQEIRNVLEIPLDNLLEALGLDERQPITQHRYQDLDAGWCYIGIKFNIPDCGICYVLARITEDGLFAIIILGASNRPWRDRIMGFVNKEPDLSKIFKAGYGNEINVQQKVVPVDIQVFRDKITETISSWIQLWKKVGGVKFLKDTQ